MSLLRVLVLASLGLVASFKPLKGLIKGAWDVFGRVPNDDFLFRTADLVNPRLLSRTFTETVFSFAMMIMSHLL